MHHALTTYFQGEKHAGLVLAGVGLAALLSAIVLMPARWELRSFAITLAVWGLLELAIGAGLYFKTGPQVARLAVELTNDAPTFFAAERPRMATVQRNFVVLEYVWLPLITVSAAVAVWRKIDPVVCGIALGFLINTSVLLAFDIVAERRGRIYLAALDGQQA